MKSFKKENQATQVGHHLRNLVKITSNCGLFLSLSGTGLIWAGAESFNCSAQIWEMSLVINILSAIFSWIVYLPFRNTDRLLGNGLLAICILFDIFWLFGVSSFYFYFLFAPVNGWLRVVVLSVVTLTLFYRAYVILGDIQEAFRNNKRLFNRMYVDEGASFTFRREAVGFLEKARRNRNPFKSIHVSAAVIVTPFVLVLNRVLTPFLGDGHGVFLALALFAVPMLLWGVEILVQTIVIMVYYPIKLQRESGKHVLLKDW